MQITERMYPVLGKLNKGKLGMCDTHSVDIDSLSFKPDVSGATVMNYISINWTVNYVNYAKNVFYLCRSLEEHLSKYVQCVDKMSEDDFIVEFWKKDHVGTIIYNGLTYCYEMFKNHTVSIYVFLDNQIIFCNTRGVNFISKTIGNDPRDFYDNLFYVLFFIDHAKIETKELRPGKKETFNQDKWVNNSCRNITIVDSLWFTTLVRSDAFSVRGHFRLQPYKDRKELIWISEFEKSGYTRNAKKINFYNDPKDIQDEQ